MKPISKPNKEELERLYIFEKISVKKLSEHFNVAKDTVKNWIINYNLNYRGFGPKKILKDFVRPSKEELYNLYNKQKLTLREVGKIYNVGKTCVRGWFNKYNLKARSNPQEAKLAKKNISLPDKKQLINDYEFFSIELIARRYNVSTESILTLLGRYGIQKRNRSQSKILAEKTGRFVSWNKGLTKNDPKVSRMIQNLHQKHMEKIISASAKTSKTRKRLFAEGKLKIWSKGKTGVFSEETINKIRVARLRQKITQKNTKPERLMLELLKKENLTEGLVEQYGLNIGKFSTIPDFAYPKDKVAIYCDGEFWHGGFHHLNQNFDKMKEGRVKEGIKKTMKKDSDIHFALWRNGWVPLRFWQHQIEREPEWMIEQIKKNLFDKEFIKEREEKRKILLQMKYET